MKGIGWYNQVKPKFDKMSIHNTSTITIEGSSSSYFSVINELLGQVDYNTLKHALSQSFNGTSTFSILFVTLSTSLSWYFDSVCCNYMTVNSCLFKLRILCPILLLFILLITLVYLLVMLVISPFLLYCYLMPFLISNSH